MRPRNLLISLTALLPLGFLAPTAVSAHVSDGQPAPRDCTNVLVGAEIEDNNDELLGGLFEDDDEQASANICLDHSFDEVRSGNAGTGRSDDDGLLDDLLGTDDGDDGLLGDLLGTDGRDGDDGLLGDLLGSDDRHDEGGLLGGL